MNILQLTLLCNGVKLEMPLVATKPANDKHSPSFSGKRNTQSPPKLKVWQNSADCNESQYREQNVDDMARYLTRPVCLLDTASLALMIVTAIAESAEAAKTLSLKRSKGLKSILWGSEAKGRRASYAGGDGNELGTVLYLYVRIEAYRSR